MVSKVRRLGQQLDLLVEKFRYGILGLLPLAVDVLAAESMLNISDDLYVSLILHFVDEIVTGICHGTLGQSTVLLESVHS